MHTLLVEQSVEVVEHICGRITILRHEDMHPTHATHQRRRIERKSPADQILEMDGDALFSMFLYQLCEGFCPLDTLQNIIYTLQNAEFYSLNDPHGPTLYSISPLPIYLSTFSLLPTSSLSSLCLPLLTFNRSPPTVQSAGHPIYQGSGHRPYPDSGRPRSSAAPYISTSNGGAATTDHCTGTMPHRG